MARYIDADVLIDMLSNYYRQTQSLYDGVPQNEQVFGMRVELNGILGDIEVIIDNVPEADVVEVKRGKWKYRPLQNPYSISYQMLIFCNNCTARFIRLPGVHFNYCPNCGAKMDGGENDEDLC